MTYPMPTFEIAEANEDRDLVIPEREAAIAAAPYVDAQVFTEDFAPGEGPPLSPRDPDWLAPLLAFASATAACLSGRPPKDGAA